MAFYSKNDKFINEDDKIKDDHDLLVISECDFDGDGSVTYCEVWECLVKVENKIRDEKCPGEIAHIVCDNPFKDTCECPEALSCEDVAKETKDWFNYHNNNGKGKDKDN